MGKINLGRVFLGGIAAGAFTVVVQYIAVFLGLSVGLRKVTGVAHYSVAAQLTFAGVVVLVGGPLAIWLYAAIRPRFGAGPRTAIITAVWIWLALGPYEQTVVSTIGLVKPMPLGMLVAMDIASLPFIIAAVLIGAWLYKEEGTAAGAKATAR